jgi:hypothetical protein
MYHILTTMVKLWANLPEGRGINTNEERKYNVAYWRGNEAYPGPI